MFTSSNPLSKMWLAYSRLIFGTPPLFSIFAPEYFHVRAICQFVTNSLKSISTREYILDVGCGDQRYRKYVSEDNFYIGMDDAHSGSKCYYSGGVLDIIGDIRAIPLQSNSIDCILCTEVLEHVNDTTRALREVSRVLRDPGLLIITVPFIFPEHNSPNDFYRFTMGGIRFVCEQAGLKIDKRVKLGGLGTVFVDLIVRILGNLTTPTTLGKRLLYPFGLFAFPPLYLLFNIVGYFLNFIPLSQFYSGVGIVCKKDI